MHVLGPRAGQFVDLADVSGRIRQDGLDYFQRGGQLAWQVISRYRPARQSFQIFSCSIDILGIPHHVMSR